MDPVQLDLLEIDAVQKKRSCDECGREYAYKKSDSKYCSSTCRSTACRKGKSLGSTSPMSKEEKTELKGGSLINLGTLPPHAQYIISHQEKENDRLQKRYDEALTKIETLQDEKNKLRDELATLKTDHRIEAIENAKPGGLAGLAENPVVQQLLPHIGPSLGRVLERFLLPAEASQMVGIEGLDEEGQQQIQLISGWFSSLPKQGQAIVYTMIDMLSSMPKEKLPSSLTQIINLLQHGTTAIPTPPQTGTFGI
jgi:hypothetical protein